MRSPLPVADCHGHLGVHPDFPACKSRPEELLEVMDLLNVRLVAVTSTLACYNDCPRGNAEVEKVLKRYPDRFRGYVTVNPHPLGEALRELEHWAHFHDPPLIKLHPFLHRYPVNERNYLPVWDYAHETRAIVLVHTWDSDPMCSPLLLAPVARQFPRAMIILGHSGVTWRGYQQAMEVATEAPNTFLDITGSQSHRTILEAMVARVGSNRILFGSDIPFLDAAVPLGRVLTARIRDAEKEEILRDNFLRLLGKSAA